MTAHRILEISSLANGVRLEIVTRQQTVKANLRWLSRNRPALTSKKKADYLSRPLKVLQGRTELESKSEFVGKTYRVNEWVDSDIELRHLCTTRGCDGGSRLDIQVPH